MKNEDGPVVDVRFMTSLNHEQQQAIAEYRMAVSAFDELAREAAAVHSEISVLQAKVMEIVGRRDEAKKKIEPARILMNEAMRRV